MGFCYALGLATFVPYTVWRIAAIPLLFFCGVNPDLYINKIGFEDSSSMWRLDDM